MGHKCQCRVHKHHRKFSLSHSTSVSVNDPLANRFGFACFRVAILACRSPHPRVEPTNRVKPSNLLTTVHSHGHSCHDSVILREIIHTLYVRNLALTNSKCLFFSLSQKIRNENVQVYF